MTFHTLALIIAAACALIASIVSFYLIIMHATHYTKPYEQRQYVLPLPFPVPVPLLTPQQHHPNPLHDSRICCIILPPTMVLLARGILPRHIRLLRSIRHRLLLCAPVPLHCAEPPRTKAIFPNDTTKRLGIANLMV
jgi:hypothetical protein